MLANSRANLTTAPQYFARNFIFLVGNEPSRKADPMCPQNVTVLNNNSPEFESHLGQIIERQYVAIIIYLDNMQACLNYLRSYLQLSETYLFVVVYHEMATEDANFRWSACELGAHMVTHDYTNLTTALSRAVNTKTGAYTCPYCDVEKFTQRELYEHVPLFHESVPKMLCCTCPICNTMSRNFFKHLFYEHGDREPEERTGFFSICIVQRPSDKAFLMVQEGGGEGFWVPGGGLDPGESYSQGAIRETIEEAGVFIELKGILNFEAAAGGKWKRIVFFAEPKDDLQVPKTIPDHESNGACWVRYEQLKDIKLRNASEPYQFFKFIIDGGIPAPMNIPQSKKYFFNKDPPL